MPNVTVIIPTWNNEEQLYQCLESLTSTEYQMDIIVVNNGSSDVQYPNVQVITTGENLGWEGGLKEGLKHTTSKYVVFCNDDVFLPYANRDLFKNMERMLEENPKIGAIGPSTNVAMGFQGIWQKPWFSAFSVPFLIGFCMFLRRSALDEAGGVDDTAPGGDDLDLSIRLRDAGYLLVCYKDGFIFHHGFQTGIRVHGDPLQPMGWNSHGMRERTDDWLIRKHGFLKWWNMLIGQQEIRPL